ncbi:glycosyltransferase family 1 protein [Synechococcus sp. RSCCF101]|uniref:glycosyltransferase family 4 protein n=1 Tax=Synechococcus sp. RSCCF101 TaxID=2511069 RepID=UPI0012482E31|nr:glycosyltransferase family 4 protein [Synechococcus sp. RSCCF101]QEY33187.1 glycosyltransferase family 1 protein [Synechococcus sp. RSCCF101]
MPHIAWIGKKSPFCGNVTYGLTITEALRQRGHRVSFIHFDSGDSWPDVALPYLVKSQVYTIPSPGAQRELRDALARLQPDLVHASLTLSPLDFRLPDLCQQLGLPLVATFHPPFDAGLRHVAAGTQQLTYQLYAPALARFDRVIVFSQLQAGILERLGVPAERLAVIANGVDVNRWCPARNAPAAGAAGRGPESRDQQLDQRLGRERLFVYMGRIATEKNLEALLRAWRLVRPRGCRLVIVGDGPLRSALEPASPEPDVLWWGHEPDEATRIALLQRAEVFILPSLVEGLSLALLEAMACGAACVATDAGADGEVLEGGAGIVLRTQGVTTQLRTLLPLLRDQPVLTAELGRRARQRVLERYALTGSLSQLEGLYSALLSRRPVPERSAPGPLWGLPLA